jgi:hypothetical protein
LNKWKKAISVGMSASLLASLFTMIAASSAMAAVTVTSAGNVPLDGTSTGTATFVFTEQAIDSLAAGAGSLTVEIGDSNDLVNNTTANEVQWSGTPVVSGPGSLGTKTATIAGDTLTVTWTNSDILNVESLTVTGLTIDADVGAETGAIKAQLGGAFIAAFQGGGTASGFLATGVSIGATAATVNVTTTGCAFVNTVGVVPDAGPFAFAAGIAGTSAESLDGTAGALNAPLAGQQVLTITTAGGFTSAHNAGDVVTQTTACAPNGVLSSPGTVVNVAVLEEVTEEVVLPGENNQEAGDVTLTEILPGFFTSGATVTLTITTPGVTFSHPPLANAAGTEIFSLAGTNVAQMNPGLTTATWSVTTTSAVITTVTFTDFDYDVAASVPIGTHVDLAGSISTGKVIDPASVNNAVVGRIIVGIGATPTVYIGENNQASGLITLTESGPAFFTDGSGSNNVFALCLTTDEQFTLAPWAIVTGPATGALTLREGAGASPDNIVLGTLTTNASGSSCAYWTVWTKSTAASTIEIRATDPAAATGPLPTGPNNGPRYSVGAPGTDSAPGTVQVGIFTGTLAGIQASADSGAGSLVINAVRAFRSGVNVVALSQPTIGRGVTNATLGTITVTETLAGQFKLGQDICVVIEPRSTNFFIQDTFLKVATTNDLPIVTSNLASGLAVGTVSPDCTEEFVGANLTNSFGFSITQQAFGPTLGVLTISNVHVATTADAVFGNVLVSVRGDTDGGATAFQSIVSPAKIGAGVAGTATTRLGVTQVGAFTTSTKVQKVGKYVTYRFDFGVAAALQHVDIWGATKTGNDWSAFAKVTGRVANASGVVYYYIRQGSATWKSYRATVTGSGTLTPARQARWIP